MLTCPLFYINGMFLALFRWSNRVIMTGIISQTVKTFKVSNGFAFAMVDEYDFESYLQRHLTT